MSIQLGILFPQERRFHDKGKCEIIYLGEFICFCADRPLPHKTLGGGVVSSRQEYLK